MIPRSKRRSRLVCALRQWQAHLKTGVSGLGAYLNVPTMFLHDALGRVEAKPSALAHSLGSEEGIKDMRQNLVRNSRAIIANFNHSTVVFAVRTHPQISFSVHGIDGVVDQVCPHLVQFAAIGIHE